MSELVIFEPLTKDKLRDVANVQMKGIVARAADKGMTLSASDAALDVVLSEPHNPVSIISPFLLTYFDVLLLIPGMSTLFTA